MCLIFIVYLMILEKEVQKVIVQKAWESFLICFYFRKALLESFLRMFLLDLLIKFSLFFSFYFSECFVGCGTLFLPWIIKKFCLASFCNKFFGDFDRQRLHHVLSPLWKNFLSFWAIIIHVECII